MQAEILTSTSPKTIDHDFPAGVVVATHEGSHKYQTAAQMLDCPVRSANPTLRDERYFNDLNRQPQFVAALKLLQHFPITDKYGLVEGLFQRAAEPDAVYALVATDYILQQVYQPERGAQIKPLLKLSSDEKKKCYREMVQSLCLQDTQRWPGYVDLAWCAHLGIAAATIESDQNRIRGITATDRLYFHTNQIRKEDIGLYIFGQKHVHTVAEELGFNARKSERVFAKARNHLFKLGLPEEIRKERLRELFEGRSFEDLKKTNAGIDWFNPIFARKIFDFDAYGGKKGERVIIDDDHEFGLGDYYTYFHQLIKAGPQSISSVLSLLTSFAHESVPVRNKVREHTSSISHTYHDRVLVPAFGEDVEMFGIGQWRHVDYPDINPMHPKNNFTFVR